VGVLADGCGVASAAALELLGVAVFVEDMLE
jgi:hypothetical protein